MTSEQSDLLVVGGGIEALAAATTLAAGGRSVRLIAPESNLGEIDASWEFHPGYRTAGLRSLAPPRPGVAASLRLADFGYATRASDDDPNEKQAAALVAEMAPVIAAIQGFADSPPKELIDPSLMEILGLGATAHRTRRALGSRGFADLLRVLPMSIEDWLSERFDDPQLRAVLAAPALLAGWVGPLSPSTAFLWLLARAGGAQQIVGGAPALVQALERAATTAGVIIDLQTEVTGWLIADGQVVGADTTSGELGAAAVLSTEHPRIALLERLGSREVPATVREDLGATRSRGMVAVMHVALDIEVEGPHTRWTGESPLDWERAFDAAKHGTIPDRPCLRIEVASADDPAIAPAGGSVLKLTVFAVPTVRPEEADQQRQALEARVFEQLDTIDEGWPSAIVGHQLITPTDLEQKHHLPGGHLEGGELALDQVFSLRPCASLGKYRTPVEGLFIAGSGTHPGGPFPGSSGVLAARQMLQAARNRASNRQVR